ncbi:MAG: hypothetical protein WBA23_03700, partial [Tunicatimonas sp.]|uniref:hypothetical protein n=1 Tax=Tunicatimonas sp. TaxID=1940096 RepID=UPI003C72E047
MTKYQWLGLVGVCLLVGSQAVAQGTGFTNPKVKKQSTITDETPRLPWGVGLDLLWLVDKNNVPATSLFIRRNVSPDNRLPGAWRLRVAADFDEQAYSFHREDQYGESSDVTVLIQPGYEWQRWMGKHQVYYGADLLMQYNVSHSERAIPINENIQSRYYHGENKIWRMGPVGFLGYQYFLSPHVAFSTEAAYRIVYWRRSESSVTHLTNPWQEGEK